MAASSRKYRKINSGGGVSKYQKNQHQSAKRRQSERHDALNKHGAYNAGGNP